jgi:hypothetical protein
VRLSPCRDGGARLGGGARGDRFADEAQRMGGIAALEARLGQL